MLKHIADRELENGVPLNRPYLPAFSRYQFYLKKMFKSCWLTNNGPLVRELNDRLCDYLGVKNLILTANGTSALQLAYRAFELDGNIVTTPFSFVATAGSANWLGLRLKFADIDPASLNISPSRVIDAVNQHTSAILPVHVYGNTCDVNGLEAIAKERNVRIIYDACHSFGVKKNGKSILTFGDASALSFHSTKLFHAIEGGALVINDEDIFERAQNMINFGIDPKDGSIASSGFNGKMSEAHAAMGLAMLESIDHIIDRRCALFEAYEKHLNDIVEFPAWDSESSRNAAYFPIILKDQEQCDRIFNALNLNNVQSRRYFYPSLNTVESFNEGLSTLCPNSERAARRILCLPLFFDLQISQIKAICRIIKQNID